MNYLKTFLPYLFGNKKGRSFCLPENINWQELNFEETLMFHALSGSLHDFFSKINLKNLSSKEVLHLLNFKEYLNQKDVQDIYDFFPKEFELHLLATKAVALNVQELQEVLDYKNFSLTIFALFTKGRRSPGKLFIRDESGRFFLDEKNHIWTIPILGLSGRGLPFYASNGDTPAGIYSIDSVMPEANKPYEFGEFRRLIVNFLTKSPEEENIKQFLPSKHRNKNWWKPAVLARELGRSLLRIHGTGRVNKNPLTPFFPMVPTSGCLATLELKYGNLVKIKHQRKLLDALMKASNLSETFENESKIHGILYVIDFDGTYQALRFRG